MSAAGNSGHREKRRNRLYQQYRPNPDIRDLGRRPELTPIVSPFPLQNIEQVLEDTVEPHFVQPRPLSRDCACKYWP